MSYVKQIAEVYKRIKPYIRKTPLLASFYFSQKTNCKIFFKCENLQYTNAFKVRGAFSKITKILDSSKIIITASAGNHGLAVAYAAKQFSMTSLIIVPEFVPKFRIDKIKALGAKVIVHGRTMDDLSTKVSEFIKDPKYIYVHGFDDEDVIAGQATIAYEILEKMPDIDAFVVSVGGGGLISGIAQYAKTFNPAISIYGVETLGTDSMAKSLKANHVVTLHAITSIAISLGVTRVAERNFNLIREQVSEVVTVSDNLAIKALKNILEKEKLLVEPASSCALAAIMAGKFPSLEGKKVAVILSGGNLSLDQLKTYL